MSHRIQMRCDDYDVIGAVPRDLSVIKNFLKGDCAVKRLIDIEEEILRECEARNEESKPKPQPQSQTKQRRKSNGNGKGHANGNGNGNGNGKDNGHRRSQEITDGNDNDHDHERRGSHAQDPCESLTPPEDKMPNYCDPCGHLKTSLVLEELTKPAITNPALNKPSISYFDEETVMGSALPVKYRFRRTGNNNDYEKPMNLLSNPTENTNVVVLTNCCDLLVWPSQRVQQMNRVPVTTLSGSGDLTEYMLEEETVM